MTTIFVTKKGQGVDDYFH